jgi:hypothetical protein
MSYTIGPFAGERKYPGRSVAKWMNGSRSSLVSGRAEDGGGLPPFRISRKDRLEDPLPRDRPGRLPSAKPGRGDTVVTAERVCRVRLIALAAWVRLGLVIGT